MPNLSRSAGARAMWARRRQELGPSGFSEAGLAVLRQNLLAADSVWNDRRRGVKSPTCRRGHPRETRWCNECAREDYRRRQAIRDGRARVFPRAVL